MADKCEIRVRGTRYMIRKENFAGTITYKVEDWRGNTVAEVPNPAIPFNEWVGEYVKGLIGPQGDT